jgi:5'-AMP-activated protein kinase catalytic alpha subunit
LKPENLLLDEHKNIKIVDFGLSNTYSEGQKLSTACGSPCYAAPEMIEGKTYHGSQVDIWSCGVILYAMICGQLPFEDQVTSVLYKKIIKGDFKVPSYVSDDGASLLKKILNTNPNDRVTVNEIREHNWFKLVPMHESEKLATQGIIVGLNAIPVNRKVLDIIETNYDFDREHAKKCLQQNKHNYLTTTYYLVYKMFERQGMLSKDDELDLLSEEESPREKKKDDALSKTQKITTENLDFKEATDPQEEATEDARKEVVDSTGLKKKDFNMTQPIAS